MPGTRGPVPVPLQAGGRDLTQQILDLLDEKEPLQTNVDFPDTPQSEIKAALDRLASRSMLTYETNDTEQVLLTGEGQTICDEGSHEYKVWDAVQQKGQLPLKELPVGHIETLELENREADDRTSKLLAARQPRLVRAMLSS